MFNEMNYAFWKIRMKIFMESIDSFIWEVVVHGPYVPMRVVKDEEVAKPRSEWSESEKKKAQYDLVAKNIITLTLTMDEFFRISQCSSAKKMWEVLEVTHEGIEDVKRSRKHSLIQEYELFRMQPEESIVDVQKRFTHIVNHLTRLGKVFYKEELNIKVLKCLDRSWQPITEKGTICIIFCSVLQKGSKRNQWYLESGCSKHMTSDLKKFTSLKLKAEGHVTYGDNNRGRILGRGTVGTENSTTIENVLYVEGLKHNLLSINQLYDKGYKVNFKSHGCTISNDCSGKVLFTGKRVNNIYLLDILETDSSNECLLSRSDESWLWHRKLAHIHTNHLNKLKSKDLVSGLPNIKFQDNRLCDACVKGKLIRSSFNSKDIVSTKNTLDVLHMDLFGASRVASLVGNLYALVVVDDYSRYTWTLFLAYKNYAYNAFKKLAKVLQNENGCCIKSIRSDHGVSFKMLDLKGFVKNMGYHIAFQPLGLSNKMV